MKTAKTVRQLAFEVTGGEVEAVVLTRNDPVRLNACLWSIFNQTVKPGGVLVVNSGAWVGEPVGGTLDIISERMDVRLRRVMNGRLGDVHADALLLARAPYVWFFQDDAVAAPNALEKLLMGLPHTVLPTVVYPDYEPMPGEGEEMPQEVAYAVRVEPQSNAPMRGPCLGLLMPRETARKIAEAIRGLPMGLDDALVQLAQPRLLPTAFVYHTRPEKPRWNRIVDLMRKDVLPRLKMPPE